MPNARNRHLINARIAVLRQRSGNQGIRGNPLGTVQFRETRLATQTSARDGSPVWPITRQAFVWIADDSEAPDSLRERRAEGSLDEHLLIEF